MSLTNTVSGLISGLSWQVAHQLAVIKLKGWIINLKRGQIHCYFSLYSDRVKLLTPNGRYTQQITGDCVPPQLFSQDVTSPSCKVCFLLLLFLGGSCGLVANRWDWKSDRGGTESQSDKFKSCCDLAIQTQTRSGLSGEPVFISSTWVTILQSVRNEDQNEMTHRKQLAQCLAWGRCSLLVFCKHHADGKHYLGCLTFQGSHLHNWQPVGATWLKQAFGWMTTVF